MNEWSYCTSDAQFYLTRAIYTGRTQNACNLKPSDLHRSHSARKQMALGDQISCYELLSKIRVANCGVMQTGRGKADMSPVVWGPMIAPGTRMFVSWELRVMSGCLCGGQMPRPGIPTECVWVRVWSGDTKYLYTYKDRVDGVGRKRNLLR